MELSPGLPKSLVEKKRRPSTLADKDDEVIFGEDEELRIIHQKTEKLSDDTKCLFNVYFNEKSGMRSGSNLENIVQIEVINFLINKNFKYRKKFLFFNILK